MLSSVTSFIHTGLVRWFLISASQASVVLIYSESSVAVVMDWHSWQKRSKSVPNCYRWYEIQWATSKRGERGPGRNILSSFKLNLNHAPLVLSLSQSDTLFPEATILAPWHTHMLSIHTEHLKSDVVLFSSPASIYPVGQKQSHCATGPDKDLLSHRKKPSGSRTECTVSHTSLPKCWEGPGLSSSAANWFHLSFSESSVRTIPHCFTSKFCSMLI